VSATILHVMDLAEGHVRILDFLVRPGVYLFNLGTGKGISVFQMIKSFERVTETKVPYRVVSRREGDLPAFWADVSKAEREMGWQAIRTLDDMMADTWRWQQKNPQGYS
jgi:UDP-glucose 4-epimerase